MAGQFVKKQIIPPSVYDLTRDPAVNLRLKNTSVTYALAGNSAALNDACEKMGYDGTGQSFGFQRGVRDPVYIPAGHYVHQGFTIGQTAAVNGVGGAATRRATMGGEFLTGGMFDGGLQLDAKFNVGANSALLVTNSLSSGYNVRYVGAWHSIGFLDLRGAILSDSTAWTNRAAATKTASGILVESLHDASVGEGKLQCAGAFLQCFAKGVNIAGESGDTGDHCDHLSWGVLAFDTCNIGYYCGKIQSLQHRIGEVFSFANVPKIFQFDRGGRLQVDSVVMNGDNQTLLTLGAGWDNNYNPMIINNVAIDGATDAPVLLVLNNSVARDPVDVTITGNLQTGTTYTAANLVQGAQPTDRIFINFSGPSDSVVKDFNDHSTVDSEGNWRREYVSIQVGSSGANLTTGDGKNYLAIPARLDGWRLELVEGSLDVASSSGTPTIQLRRKRSGSDVDMLSTRITFDANETTTATAATASVVNTSNDDLATSDRIYVDIDVAGTGAQWLALNLTFRRW